jgi:tetratricopeptide (TPR) repeat protein
MYSNMERYPEALADFDRALKLNPRNTDALIGKGLVLTYTAEYAEAQKVYKRVYDMNPKDFTNLYNLAAVTVRAKDVEGAKKEIFNARKALEKLLNGMYHGRGLYGLGGLAALEGDANAALDYLKRAMTYERQAKLWASKDIAWLDLRDDPRFKAIVKD